MMTKKMILLTNLLVASMTFAQYVGKGSVTQKLFSGEKQLQAWADELEKTQPQTPAEVWDALEVLVRAERDEAVLRLMPHVCEVLLASHYNETCDAKAPHNRLANVLLRLPPERGRLCIAYFETVGTVLSVRYVFEDLKKLMKRMNWSDSQITDWTYGCYQAALAVDSKRKLTYWPNHFLDAALYPMSYPAQNCQYWYFSQLSKSPDRAKVFQKIKDDARKSPNDLKKMAFFLESVRYTGGIDPKDAGWLLTAFKQSAYGSYVVGCMIHTDKNLKGKTENDKQKMKMKEAFLKQALSKPLTVEECGKFSSSILDMSSEMQPKRSEERTQAMFRVTVMDEMNRLYLKDERSDDAQNIMLEARALRKEYGLPNDFMLAGESNFRGIVEAEIKEQEVLDETKLDYWIERAEYYRGRKNIKSEEEALRRALALDDVTNMLRDEKVARENIRMYYGYFKVFPCLFQLLWRNGCHDEALALFKAQRAVARHNAFVLSKMYDDCESVVLQAGRFDELKPGLLEDLRDAYEQIKAASKDNPAKYAMLSPRTRLFSSHFALAIHADILDFENDLCAWDIFAGMSTEDYLPNIGILLKSTKVPKEKIIQKLKDLTNEQRFGSRLLTQIGKVLHAKGDSADANWFLRAAADCPRSPDSEKQWCYPELIANYLKAGDWQNSEDYIYRFAKIGHCAIDALRQTADLAENSGATDAARRMRERIKNLGAMP